MDNWTITKSSAVPPRSANVDSAYCVKVARGEASRDVVVEFLAPSSLTSIGYAEEITRPYLAGSEPPQHLVVDVSGTVQVVLGPLEGMQDEAAGPLQRETGRARPRRRS
jgi:hypothetical protein